jgi:hypothetical protein
LSAGEEFTPPSVPFTSHVDCALAGEMASAKPTTRADPIRVFENMASSPFGSIPRDAGEGAPKSLIALGAPCAEDAARKRGWPDEQTIFSG